MDEYIGKGALYDALWDAKEEKKVKSLKDVFDFIDQFPAEDGVIAPPCKVGDTVYSFCDAFGPILILPYFIETFRIGFLDKNRDYWAWEANSHSTETDELLDEIDFDLDDIGKTVFLTKEAAEQKLKEMREANDR